MFIVALLLFLALVTSWVLLPGSPMESPVQENSEPLPANRVRQAA